MIRLLMNLRLSNKILVAPVAVIGFLIAFGIVAYWSLSHQKVAIEEIFGVRFQSLRTSAGLIKDVTSVHASLYKVISWANANYDAQKIDALGKEQIKVLDQALAMMDRVLKTKKLAPEEDRSYKTVRASLADYRKDAFEAIDLASTDVNYATTYMEKAEERFQSLYRELGALLEVETKLGQLTYDGAVRNYSTSLQVSLVVLVVAIIISILLSLFIAKLIAAPVRKAIAVIRKIAEGDLTQTIEMRSKDEIGLLCQSVDIMRQKMGEAVGGSVETSQVLSEAASEQAASIEETSSSLEEMASMIKSNASSTSRANELMNQAERTIEKANTSMNQLTASMKEIAVASEQTQKIVKTIDEIAFQTNLLALNAAVEAARAGEAGAGFAVVAEEVRNLALRASDAAKNTSTLMGDIAKKINAGERLVHETHEDFSAIKTRSDEVVKLMGSIATSSKEQSEGIEQINQAILQLNQTTQQNAASAEELASIMTVFITEAAGSQKPTHPRRKAMKAIGAPGDEERLPIPAEG